MVGDSDGAVLNDNLRIAALRALRVRPGRPRARALRFDWERVCDEFVSFLVPAIRPQRSAALADEAGAPSRVPDAGSVARPAAGP